MSIDLRTRVDSEQTDVEAGPFFREALPSQLDAHQHLIEPGGSQLELKDFCIEVDSEPWTLCWRGDRVVVASGNGVGDGNGGARVRLTGEQLSEIVNDQSTPVALMSNAILDMP